MNEPLLREEHVAELLSVSRSALQKGRLGLGALSGLAYLKLGTAVRYELRAVEDFRATRTVRSTPAISPNPPPRLVARSRRMNALT